MHDVYRGAFDDGRVSFVLIMMKEETVASISAQGWLSAQNGTTWKDRAMSPHAAPRRYNTYRYMYSVKWQSESRLHNCYDVTRHNFTVVIDNCSATESIALDIILCVPKSIAVKTTSISSN
jgi:hypothetical protein